MSIYYTVYKTICLLNQKEYIGVHVTENPDDTYLGSGLALNKAIKKYGRENFKKEVLFLCESVNSMYAKERELVDINYVRREDTYNMKVGGTGVGKGEEHPSFGKIRTEETKQKLRDVAKVNRTEEYRRKLSLAKQNISQETRNLLSEKAKNRKPISEETRQRMREAAKRRMESQETREKLRQASLGKSASEETRRKIGEKSKGRKPKPLSSEQRKSISEKIINLPKFECPHCNRMFQISHLKQYHLDKCKNKGT